LFWGYLVKARTRCKEAHEQKEKQEQLEVDAQLVGSCNRDTESQDNKPTLALLMKMKMTAVAFNKCSSN
jgi:hypothetical protein